MHLVQMSNKYKHLFKITTETNSIAWRFVEIHMNVLRMIKPIQINTVVIQLCSRLMLFISEETHKKCIVIRINGVRAV